MTAAQDIYTHFTSLSALLSLVCAISLNRSSKSLHFHIQVYLHFFFFFTLTWHFLLFVSLLISHSVYLNLQSSLLCCQSLTICKFKIHMNTAGWNPNVWASEHLRSKKVSDFVSMCICEHAFQMHFQIWVSKLRHIKKKAFHIFVVCMTLQTCVFWGNY